MSFIAITDTGGLIPIKRGQVLTGMGFLGLIVTNSEDLANDEHGVIGCRFNKPHSGQLQQEIIQLLARNKESDSAYVSDDAGASIQTRTLVIQRHPRSKGRLILCDEKTGQPLDGQTSLVVESGEDGMAKVTVTFEAGGAYGVLLGCDPRPEY